MFVIRPERSEVEGHAVSPSHNKKWSYRRKARPLDRAVGYSLADFMLSCSQ